MKQQNYIYELVKNKSDEKKPNIDVILKEYVDGLGNVGQRVSVKPQWAYSNLLLPGLAVYASPENVEKYEDEHAAEKTDKHSSPTASLTVQSLSRILLSVVMNMEEKWTLEPWHIKASFRKCGYTVPEQAISLPEELISGPNMDLEDKEFYVTVTINNLEKVNVRCRIHHWSTDIKNRLEFQEKFWLTPTEPIFADQKEMLLQMPKKREKVVIY